MIKGIGAWLSSSWNNKCPRCRVGTLFVEPFVLLNPLHMPERCPHCSLKYEPEPGFYFGAMFISYILSSFVLLIVAAICVIYFGMTAEGMIGIVIIIGCIIYLKVLRLSRSVWIHITQKYDARFTVDK